METNAITYNLGTRYEIWFPSEEGEMLVARVLKPATVDQLIAAMSEVRAEREAVRRAEGRN